MPLYRRLPKRGFTNIFHKEFVTVNVERLDGFESGAQIDPIVLRDNGIIKNLHEEIKILGDGDLTKALTVRAHKFSKSAVDKIQKAGGTIEVIV
jgi:large subunit ribosomal protein L15